MKPSLFIIISVMPLMALADNTLSKHPDFNRYRTMLNRSFASARTAPPTSISKISQD